MTYILSITFIWLYVLIKSSTHFRVTLQSAVKKFIARNRHNIINSSDLRIGTTRFEPHNHLVWKRARTQRLVKLAKWLNSIVSTNLYTEFWHIFLSCHIHVLEWIYIVELPECQGTHCLKQARYLTFKWLKLNLNPQTLSLSTNTQPFSQIGQMIELYVEYLSVQFIWLNVLIMSHTRFTANLHFIFAIT